MCLFFNQIERLLLLFFAIDVNRNLVLTKVIASGCKGFKAQMFTKPQRSPCVEQAIFQFEHLGRERAVRFLVMDTKIHYKALIID